MNSYKPSFVSRKLRNLFVLALLLGGLCATRVSNAQTESIYLTNALKASGDAAGTITPSTSATVIEQAFAREAQQTGTNGTELIDYSGANGPAGINDLGYALNALGATNANNDFSLILGKSLFQLTGANFALVSGTVGIAVEPYVLDTNKYLLSYSIAGAAVQLSETQVITDDTVQIAESLSPGASFDSNVGLVITGATYPYYAPPTGFSQNLPAIAPLADNIATALSAMTIADYASTALAHYQYEPSAALTTGTTLENTVLGSNSVSAAGTVAYDFSLDIPVYAANFAGFAASIDSINSFEVAAISGSAATAAPAYATSIATAVAQAQGVPATDAGGIAGAIASVVALSDSTRFVVAENVVTVDNTQAPSVGGDVAPSLTSLDKAYLAYYLGLEVNGNTINRAGDIPAISGSIAAAISGNDPNLGVDEGTVAYGADLAIATSSSAGSIVSLVATNVANALVSGSAMSYAVQAVISQTAVAYLDPSSGTAYPALAITTATSVEQAAYTDYASVTGSNAPAITAAFAAALTTHYVSLAANLAALGAGDYPAFSAAVSGSATAALGSAANSVAPLIATSASQAVAAIYGGPIAAAITQYSGLTDSTRLTVAENVITVDNGQDVAVSSAVAPNVTNLDKAYLAYYVGLEVNGNSINRAGDIPSIAGAIAATLPGTDSTLGADEGLIGYGADLPVVTSSSASTLVSAVGANIAGAIVSGSSIPYLVQATIAQTISAYLDPASGTAYPSLALASSTSVEQVAYTDFAAGGTNAPSITGAFAADLVAHDATFAASLAALGAGDYPTFAAAVSGSATAALGSSANTVAPLIATSVSQAVNSSYAASIAAAISGVVIITDTSRFAVAENIVENDQAQDAAVAGAVAPNLTNLDKAYLAYYIGIEVSGTIGRSTDLPTIAFDVAATVSATDPALGTDEGLIAYGAALSGSTGGQANTLIPAIGNAVASVMLSGSNLPLIAQGTIVETVDYYFPSQAIITSTTVESTAITDQTLLTSATAARVAVATVFATDVPTLSGTIATFAATGQTGTEAGLIGAKVSGISASIASGSGAAIAVDVALAAQPAGIPTGVRNDTIGEVAYQFAQNSGSGTGLIGFQYDAKIAQNLAQLVVSVSGTNDALRSDAVASIAQYFAMQMGNDPNDLATMLGDIVSAVPYDAADTLAAVLHVLPSNFPYTPAQIESYVDSIVDSTTDLAMLGLSSGQANNDINTAFLIEQSPDFGGVYPSGYANGVTPDETPIVDMTASGS